MKTIFGKSVLMMESWLVLWKAAASGDAGLEMWGSLKNGGKERSPFRPCRTFQVKAADSNDL